MHGVDLDPAAGPLEDDRYLADRRLAGIDHMVQPLHSLVGCVPQVDLDPDDPQVFRYCHEDHLLFRQPVTLDSSGHR